MVSISLINNLPDVQHKEFLKSMNEVSRLLNNYEEFVNNLHANLRSPFSNKFEYFFYQNYLNNISFYYSN